MTTLHNEWGLIFGEPRIVMTKYGERAVREAEPTEQFWTAWRSNKAAIKAAGFSVSKAYGSDKWNVAHWAKTMSRDEREAAQAASRATSAAIEIPKPAGLSDDYMPFQKAGIAYALERDATLIGDDMGLGKTIQAIGFANAIKARRILVVAPASLLANWRNEIRKWQTLDLPVTIMRPGKGGFNHLPGWFVINYDIVNRYPEMKASTWDLVVYDECQYLKSRTALRTVTLLGGTKTNRKTKVREKHEGVAAIRKLMLTGTPIMNRPAELWPILHHLDPKRWGSWSGFTRRYCGATHNGYGYDTSGASNLDELNARLRETVMVRRLKKDVLTELPAKRRQIVELDVNGAEEIVKREVEAYERNEKAIAMASALVQEAEVAGDEEAYQAAVKKLKEVQGVAFSEMSRLRHETAIAKLPAVIEHLKATTDKVLVFAWHKDVVEAICAAVKDEGVVSITGDTANEKRQPIVDQFQNDASIRFFVGNIKAAGVGLTLTASSHVVFAELDWTPSSISQAEDRAHRIGQRESVLVQHLVFDGSLDARMAKVVVAKQEIIERALDKKVAVTEDEEPVVAIAEPAPAKAQPGADDRRAKLDAIAATLTPEQIAAIHAALRTVAAMDADRASQLNGHGFSKLDTIFGCQLAEQASLSPRQAAVGMKLARKYRRQYDEYLYRTIFGDEVSTTS